MTKKAENPVEATQASAGKGKKTCPQCSAVVGARTKTCECGHVFVAKTSTKKVVSYEDQLTLLRSQMEARLVEIDELTKKLAEEKKIVKERLEQLTKIEKVG